MSMCLFGHVTDPFTEVCLLTFGPYLPSQPPWSAYEHLTSLARSAGNIYRVSKTGSRPICSSKHSIAPLLALFHAFAQTARRKPDPSSHRFIFILNAFAAHCIATATP